MPEVDQEAAASWSTSLVYSPAYTSAHSSDAYSAGSYMDAYSPHRGLARLVGDQPQLVEFAGEIRRGVIRRTMDMDIVTVTKDSRKRWVKGDGVD